MRSDAIRCYLAGAIQHDNDPHRWRDELIGSNNKRNIEFINPLDLVPEEEAGEAEPERIVREDLTAIDNCDTLIVRWKPEVPKAGTPMEMMYAAGREIPIVTWYEGPMEDLSPWVRYFSDEIVENGSQTTSAVQKVL